MTRSFWLYGALPGLVVLLFLLSLDVGRVTLPLQAWFGRGPETYATIFLELRLPRAILGFCVGAALGLSGAALQGYTRNPLADPGVLGVSSMAALGAVLTLYSGAAALTPWLLSAAAMLGAAIGVVLLLALAGTAGGVVTFLLAGVMLNSAAFAFVDLTLNLAPSPWTAQEIVNWLLGSISDRSFVEIETSLPFMIPGAALLFGLGRALDSLTLGEMGARSLGTDLRRSQILLALGVAMTAGASVSVTGVIGFVGLIVPHLVRPLVGQQPSRLLLPSALAGAAFLLAGDILVRLIPSVVEIRLGVAMSIIGAPFFLALLLNRRRQLA